MNASAVTPRRHAAGAPPTRPARSVFAFWRALGLSSALVFAACSPGGDGGGIGGSGVIPPGTTPVASADLSVGPIAGFGSVRLNGRRFDTDDAAIEVNGEAADESALARGMVVLVEGDFETLEADRVDYEASLIGPLERVDAAGETLLALGRTIRLRPDTELGALAVETLGPGEPIEASGVLDADGTLAASFLRRAPAATGLQIAGRVSALDAMASRFTLGALVVDYAGADRSALGDERLAEGTAVIVSAPIDALDADGRTLRAARLRPAPLARVDRLGTAQTDESRDVELEGIVTLFSSATRFALAGVDVVTDAATRFELADGRAASAETIALNTRLEIEGRPAANGTLRASRVIVLPAEESRLIGPIDSLDAARDTLVVLGVEVSVTPRTRLDDGGFEALRIGERVRVDAAFAAERLVATRVASEDDDSEARLRGPVTALDAAGDTIAVLGVPLVAGPGTDYELADGNEVERSGFIAALRPGDLVEARWREFVSAELPPDDIEIEREDDIEDEIEDDIENEIEDERRRSD